MASLLRLDPLAHVLAGFMRCSMQRPDAIQCPVTKPKPTKTYGRRSAAVTDSTTTASSTPTPSYVTVLSGLHASVDGSGYTTYGLVDDNADCEAFCDTVSKSIFINSYHNMNEKVVRQSELGGFMDYISDSLGLNSRGAGGHQM
ncbi:hypothetical protein EV359DRAFT_64348 [Lentinula novae-zelandiae]|nr:hypothetical protein EV359DRAFT_64348 [Lentinula novae-zelandiae]